MKLLILFLSMMCSSNVFAGAYSTYCSNPEHSVAIEKSALLITDEDGEKKYEWFSKSLPSSFSNPDLENKEAAISVNVVGKVKTIEKKTEVDECGNVASIVFFAAKVELKNGQGTMLKTTHLLCRDYSKPGHCF